MLKHSLRRFCEVSFRHLLLSLVSFAFAFYVPILHTTNKCSFNYIEFNCFDFSPWFTFRFFFLQFFFSCSSVHLFLQWVRPQQQQQCSRRANITVIWVKNKKVQWIWVRPYANTRIHSSHLFRSFVAVRTRILCTESETCICVDRGDQASEPARGRIIKIGCQVSWGQGLVGMGKETDAFWSSKSFALNQPKKK